MGSYSYHVYDCNHLICCSAGHGHWDGKKRPYGWKPRMQRSFGVAFKKRQDGMKQRLFSYRESGALESFVFPYLGQRDAKLTRDLGGHVLPDDFVHSEEVVGYPTDFRAMPPVDIERLTRRGEQLTRLLADAYGPSLL